MKTILSTRMLNKESVKKLNQLDVRIIIEEAIGIEEVDCHPLIEGKVAADAFIFTSIHGAKCFSSQLPEGMHIPALIFAIEGRTSIFIQNEAWAGKSEIITASNAAGLAEIILEKEPGKLAYFCSESRREELPESLGNRLTEYVVYKSVLTPVTAMSPPDVLLFFSPSAVQSYTSANTIEENTTAFCIGETTAAEVRKHTSRIVVSMRSTEEELIAELEKQLRNHKI